jgi:microcystin-dependent protein|tara:strand:- start:284 stop:838 length:555 start_codon:yes stop_codon:yes gene_type:complete
MPTQLQLRRGTKAQNDSFTGAAGELSIDTDANSIRVHDGSTAGGISIVPTGTILAFGSSTIPSGYLRCNDQAVSRTTYAALFAIIGTTYGTGDGSSTFNVPDLRDRAPYGRATFTIGTTTSSEVDASGQLASASQSASVSATNVTVASTAKDSSTTTVVASITVPSHTHTITYPGTAVEFIIKT